MIVSRRKPRIGLALGSGSARGWAHIGVIRALEERGVKPDVVCGTSIGALVAGVYASGELDRLEAWATGLAWKDVLKMVDVTWRGGFIRGQRLFDFFRGQFTDRDIAELPIPFGAVATDLATGREVWLREGKVLDAVRASVAIPGVFTPAVREGVVYVDGGLVNPVPVSMCRALGADVVIAVDLSWAKLGFYRERGRTLVPPQVPPREMPGWVKRIGSGWLDKVSGGNGNGNGAAEDVALPSIMEVFLTSMDIVETRVARSRLAGEPADVLITPLLPDFGTMEFHRGREAVTEGRAAVERMTHLLAQVFG
jgi:NTE family protein